MPILTMPKLSDTMTEGTLVKWLKNQGDAIEIGDILAEVETDKATMEMEAFDEGILEEVFVTEGTAVKVGDKIARIASDEDAEIAAEAEADKAKSKAEPKAAEPKAAEPKAEPSKTADRQTTHDKPAEPKNEPVPAKGAATRVKASPLAKKIAVERGIDLANVTGSGPGGRIVAADLDNAATAPTSGTAPSPSSPPAAVKLESTGGTETRVELSGMRRVIAERLLASKTQIPHFYLAVEVDAAPLMRLRKEVNAANEAADLPKVTVNDFILLAVAHAAAQNPKVNAAWGGDHVMQYDSINVAVAVAVDDGLITPVLRNADKLSLREISAAVKDLAGKARSKKLKPEDYTGGTITVSNLGAYGVDQFYAIVNPPQAAILAVGAIVKKPVVGPNDQIVAGERMTISLSGDHRVVDGAVGAEFMSSLRKLVENPALMLF